jgi:hypothetical protein
MSEFKKDGNKIIFTGKYIEVYINEYYFEKEVAEQIGDHFKVLGVVNFRTFSDVDGKHPMKLRTLNIPTMMITYPSGGYEIKNLDLVGNGEERYYVLKYYNTDELCASEIAANPANFKSFFEILLAGKLPNTIPYNGLMDIWNKNFRLNNINFDIPDSVKEIIIFKIYRWKKNPAIPFGKALADNPKLSQYDYVTMGPRDITRMDSAYAGFTFEDFDTSVIAGINTTKAGKKEVYSPIEPILKA